MTGFALVVDDAPDVRFLVATVLRRMGLRCEEADNGLTALAALSADPLPDVVVLDVQMPELDGWDTLAAIRADPRTAGVGVVMCSVRGQPADAERAWSLGCDGLVPKPFGINDLAEEVAQVMARPLEARLSERQDRLRALRRQMNEAPAVP